MTTTTTDIPPIPSDPLDQANPTPEWVAVLERLRLTDSRWLDRPTRDAFGDPIWWFEVTNDSPYGLYVWGEVQFVTAEGTALGVQRNLEDVFLHPGQRGVLSFRYLGQARCAHRPNGDPHIRLQLAD